MFFGVMSATDYENREKGKMRYYDSGLRQRENTLAYWLETAISGPVAELRFQTGFFSLDGLGLLLPALTHCKVNNLPTNILLGSNDSSTLKSDVERLIEIMGIPRGGAQLGIVSFKGGYFHPKTYHIRREDGSQAAFVGSANLTASGLALHVEAGISLDTNEGDDPKILEEIATAIDRWFIQETDGLTIVSDVSVLNSLVENDVLALALAVPPRPLAQGSADIHQSSVKKRLRPIIEIPKVAGSVTTGEDKVTNSDTSSIITQSRQDATLSTEPSFSQREGFPPYILFATDATQATTDYGAITGIPLPKGAAGLIIQLNRDSARHFAGGRGTANISIPVVSVQTLKFGPFGKHNRPRAQFNLRLRYLSDNITIDGGTVSTNVMGYGFTPSETGHSDIRMLVPASVNTLSNLIIAEGLNVPVDGDMALLEWPTSTEPSFRLSFLDNNSGIAQQAAALFRDAAEQGELAGNGACWLPPDYSPAW